MSRLTQNPRLDLAVTLKLNEPEIRALDALAGYGFMAFLDVFYKHMGRHYLEPHEEGLRSLFEVIKTDLPPILHRLDAARQAFALNNPVIRSKEEHESMIKRLIEDSQKGEASIASLVGKGGAA
ncbi:hypothetical protein EC845_1176 [Comamonas sp. BIGb0124]|uniref:hypothetical protein n=1 Tax=Comamonas sp. BIGb0124 TaxID=2485130 RepID=UPI000F8FC58A|nr:hypothetical protein [Comamonas sp. BIGb0124]ROR25136.1 hypothetical protein EC845_1176 [Comamonas sp. BIGb0124]